MLKTRKLAANFAGTGPRGFARPRPGVFVCALLLVCAFPCAAQVAETTNASSSVPTPQSVLGHKPGDDFYLANYDESREYLHKLAASSNRMKLINVGKTTRGLGLGDCDHFVSGKSGEPGQT